MSTLLFIACAFGYLVVGALVGFVWGRTLSFGDTEQGQNAATVTCLWPVAVPLVALLALATFSRYEVGPWLLRRFERTLAAVAWWYHV